MLSNKNISCNQTLLKLNLKYTRIFISITFISKIKLKLAKNQAKAKQHPEAELLLFENYTLSLSMLSSKSNMRYSKIIAKNKCVCFNGILWLIIMKRRMKMKNKSHRSSINRNRSRHVHKYTKYKIIYSQLCLSVICNLTLLKLYFMFHAFLSSFF